MKLIKLISVSSLMVLFGPALLLSSGCNDSGSSGGSGSAPTYPSTPPVTTPPPAPQPGQMPVTVQTSQSSLGEYLTDGQGRSLYLFEADSSGVSNCSGACATAWPPLTVSSGQQAVAGGSAEAPLLGTLTRADGSTQVSYKGMPLYYYAGDTAAGQTNGEGLTAFGALWYLVMPGGGALTG